MSEQAIYDPPDSRFVGSALRIALVSPARIVRESLAELLPRDSRLSIAGVFEDLSYALPRLEDPETDLALVDATLQSGRAALTAIRSAVPRVPIVVFSITETLEEVVAWAEAGAAGYVPRMAGLADVTAILLEIKKGKQSCSSREAKPRLGWDPKAREREDIYHGSSKSMLTTREMEIIKLIDEGMSNKEIARHLDIGVATTKTHIHHILGKMHVQRRGQAIRCFRGDAERPL